MKRYLIFFVPLFSLVLSGCGSGPADSGGDASGETVVERLIPQGFSQKMEKGSLWKSEDGGRSFVVRSSVDETTRIEKADILDFEFHPSRTETVIASSVEHGIFKTENGGDTWVPIPFPPKRIYGFILDRRDPDHRMFASGVIDDRGRVFRSDDEGVNWSPIYTEPGTGTVVSSLAQDPRNPDILYAGTSGGTLVKSTDAGATWKNVGDAVDGVVSRILFDAGDPNLVYLLLFGKEMSFSRDGGETWTDWDEEKRAEITSLNARAAEALKDGRTDEAAHLRDSAEALVKRGRENKAPNGMVALLADPSRSGVLYAGGGSGLYRSTDSGKFWEKLEIIESAEEFTIRSIGVDPKNSDVIVFVSGRAFYRSENGGETWSVIPLSTDRPPAQIEYDPFDSRFMFLGLRNL